jgi:serine O-acetyltransferase
VGIPARIILSKEGVSADVTSDGTKADPKFNAYGITTEDDPVSLALRGLVDSATTQDRQIALLWQALEQLVRTGKVGDCVPSDASLKECFEAEKLNQLIGK